MRLGIRAKINKLTEIWRRLEFLVEKDLQRDQYGAWDLGQNQQVYRPTGWERLGIEVAKEYIGIKIKVRSRYGCVGFRI